MVYLSPSQIDFSLEELRELPAPRKVLLTSPEYFEVKYIINPHMVGNIGTVDVPRAMQQWNDIRKVYERLGFQVSVLQGKPDLPDMVFCANQTLPCFLPDSVNAIVPSRMHAPQRQGEVIFYEEFFTRQEYKILPLPFALPGNLEGMGDAIWHSGKAMLWGGYGFRTDSGVYEYISELLDVPVLGLHLDDREFYHLDTCFSVLDQETVMIFPGAFEKDSLDLIRHFYANVIEAPEYEARRQFAVNAHCPDGRHVIIHHACTESIDILRRNGFQPVPVDTGEFLKAGGSVFCMKLMYW